MLPELTRIKQQMPPQECAALLQQETRGVLSVLGEDGYPYGMPMNHWYDESDGSLWFHCGYTGHRLAALRRCDKASFCVFDQGVRTGEDWAYRVRSVVVFGRIAIVDDPARIAAVATRLSHKFTHDEAYIRKEIEQHGHRALLLHLIPEHIRGKYVTEA